MMEDVTPLYDYADKTLEWLLSWDLKKRLIDIEKPLTGALQEGVAFQVLHMEDELFAQLITGDTSKEATLHKLTSHIAVKWHSAYSGIWVKVWPAIWRVAWKELWTEWWNRALVKMNRRVIKKYDRDVLAEFKLLWPMGKPLSEEMSRSMSRAMHSASNGDTMRSTLKVLAIRVEVAIRETARAQRQYDATSIFTRRSQGKHITGITGSSKGYIPPRDLSLEKVFNEAFFIPSERWEEAWKHSWRIHWAFAFMRQLKRERQGILTQ